MYTTTMSPETTALAGATSARVERTTSLRTDGAPAADGVVFARAHRVALRTLSRDVLACFADVDVLLAPATTGPAPDAASTGNPAFQSPWSYTGLPTVSFLAGYTPEGPPLAIQLVGRPWGEAELFRAAAWCEGTVGIERKLPPY